MYVSSLLYIDNAVACDTFFAKPCVICIELYHVYHVYPLPLNIYNSILYLGSNYLHHGTFFGGIALLRGMRQMKLEEVVNANLLLRVKL